MELKEEIIIKKIFLSYFLFLILVVQATKVSASDTVQARIGNRYFGSLEEAVAFAGPSDVISLTNNITLDETLNINKIVNINLNNFDIKAEEKVFAVQGGSLNLSGNGMIYETKPNYGAITVIGSNDPNDTNYSTINVGSNITLEGWSGVFINHNNGSAYGILVNIDGGINSVDDINGVSGAGVYVNGNIKNINNAPIINLSDTARITSSGTGIYAAGYATYNIDGAYISGSESGLGIKSGIFNIKNGIIHGSGDDKTPTSGNNNGINPSGAAIQIESNDEYKGNIKLNISGGNFESEHSNVIYEYVVNNTSTKINNIDITDGTFISKADKNIFRLSNSFKNTHKNFIAGGNYSSDVNNYLKSGFKLFKNESSLYEVTNSMSVFALEEKNKNKFFIVFTIIIITINIGIVIYAYRKNIINFINAKTAYK